MDTAIGRILKALELSDLDENTLVYFTSDHGSHIDIATNGGSNRPFQGIPFIKLQIYSVSHQYLKKFSYGFWDNQWFGRNQICIKLKLGALQFMPGIKNWNLI
jgi:arylsulfatase A-like enzyme